MTPPTIFKQFERLSKKRDAMRLRITHLQEELVLLDAEVDMVRKEMSNHGLLRDLPMLAQGLGLMEEVDEDWASDPVES